MWTLKAAVGPAREASMKKFNQFYTHLQSYSRGEITIEELQDEANKLFRF